jgi:hypothetical protein
VASKQQNEATTEDIAELLDAVDQTLDRLKTLYEQYFLGIQKQPPSFIHNDVERKLRDLTQLQIRNTGLRYRLAMLTQKFGSYNSYWRRTLRQIENGTYKRNLQKIGREAVRTGSEIPEEILAAMPKRMREQVSRDREQALAIAKRHGKTEVEPLPPEPTDDLIAMIKEPTDVRRRLRSPSGTHVINEKDNDLDIDAFFAAVQEGTIPPPMSSTQRVPSAALPRPSTPPAVAKIAGAPTPEPVRPVSRAGTEPGIQPPRPPPTPPPRPATSQAIPRPAVTPVMPPKIPQTPRPQRPITGQSPVIPAIPLPPRKVPTEPGGLPAIPRPAASQASRPNPIAPGSAAAHGAVDVESMDGPFPRERVPTPATGVQMLPKRAPAAPPQRPPPGMTDADVNALYAKYIKAKELVGEKIGPGEHSKLLKTINQQAPKIMAQYNAKAVDFSVVVKDNQVIIRAKPKS